MALSGEPLRVELRRPGKRFETEFLAAARRSRRLHRGWVTPPRDAEELARWTARVRGPRYDAHLLVDPESRALVGVVNLNEIVHGAFQSAYLGYYAFHPHQGRGHLTDGLSQVLDHGFGTLGLHRVEANVQPDNAASLRLVRRLGFRHEGTSPGYLKVAGRWRDHERWALLAAEWRRARRRR